MKINSSTGQVLQILFVLVTTQVYGVYGQCRNCDQCNGGKCVTCKNGYFSDDNGECRLCTTNCLICESEICRHCSHTHFLHGDVCIPNWLRNCILSGLDECLYCEDGFYPNSTQRCSPCKGNCLLCENETVCSVCDESYFKDSYSKCHPCPTSCVSCRDTFSCTRCKTGFWLKTSECSPCDRGCAECRNERECTKCLDGYYFRKTILDSGSCYPCLTTKWGPNCNYNCPVTCVNERCNAVNGVCESCVDGYHDESCSSLCPRNCLQHVCNVSGECIQGCNEGYWGNTCTYPCPVNCNGGRCEQAGSCTDGCLSGYSGTKCDACEDERFFGSACTEPCSVGCINRHCYRNGSCTHGCALGYGGQWCDVVCSENCESGVCDANKMCTDGCIERYTGLTCEECVDGLYGPACSLQCSSGCLNRRCYLDGSCSDGCHVGLSGPMCDVNCPGNCRSQVCDGNRMCTDGCNPGYYDQLCSEECREYDCINNECYQDNGTCIDRCPPTCVSCQSRSHCYRCLEGFYGTACQYNCSTCKSNSCPKQECRLWCEDGYFMDGNECKSCRPNCTKCESFDLCTGCIDGLYGLLCEDQCNTSNCRACKDFQSFCTKCYSGFQLVDDTCIEISENTSSIHENNTCHIEDFCNACQYRCSENCFQKIIGRICNVESGHCSHGCVDGSWGLTCEKPCNEDCLGRLCDRTHGHCLRCDNGRTGPWCRAVVVSPPEDSQDSFLLPVVITLSVVVLALILIVILQIRERMNQEGHEKSRDRPDVEEIGANTEYEEITDRPRQAVMYTNFNADDNTPWVSAERPFQDVAYIDLNADPNLAQTSRAHYEEMTHIQGQGLENDYIAMNFDEVLSQEEKLETQLEKSINDGEYMDMEHYCRSSYVNVGSSMYQNV